MPKAGDNDPLTISLNTNVILTLGFLALCSLTDRGDLDTGPSKGF